MKILLIGSGAREHALARALLADPRVETILALPGNPGIVADPRVSAVLDVPPAHPAAVAALARAEGVDLVVVGAEAPLVAGVADAVREAGVPVFGPGKQAARLEGSKAFAKEIMAAAQVPTARPFVCASEADVEAAFDELGAPYVVKDDGLAAGKGVVVTESRTAALDHARACLAKSGALAGGEATPPQARVLVEAYLDGPEVSLFCLCDGRSVVPLAPAQDFKRLADGDAGPNTGGMGAYSPLPWAPAGLTEEVVRTVAQPVVDELARRGTPFSGLLYCGLALTSTGLRVVEFNVRFGDPETQVVLARLRTPLAGVLMAAATGTLGELAPLEWDEGGAVAVVIAAPGYPETVRSGGRIDGLEVAAQLEGVHVLHAGTDSVVEDGAAVVLAAGGRVLSVVGRGASVAEARDAAYRGVAAISLDGQQHRTDIAAGI